MPRRRSEWRWLWELLTRFWGQKGNPWGPTRFSTRFSTRFLMVFVDFLMLLTWFLLIFSFYRFLGYPVFLTHGHMVLVSNIPLALLSR